MVSLCNVDNASDLNKPVSMSTQSAVNLKAIRSDVYSTSVLDSVFAQKQQLLIYISTNGVSRYLMHTWLIDSVLMDPYQSQKPSSLITVSSDAFSESETTTLLNNEEDTLTVFLPLQKGIDYLLETGKWKLIQFLIWQFRIWMLMGTWLSVDFTPLNLMLLSTSLVVLFREQTHLGTLAEVIFY